MPAAGSGLEYALVGFGRALRKEGLIVGSGHIVTYCECVGQLDPTELADLYYGGRSCLIHRPNDIPMYNRVFKAYFLDPAGEGNKVVKMKQQASAETEALMEMLNEEEKEGEEREGEPPSGIMASTLEVLRKKAFGECTPEELAALRALMARFRLIPPKRLTRRTEKAHKGRRPALRDTVRKAMRHGGEITELSWRRRKYRQRRLILILDISGSMSTYSRALLQFAYSTTRVPGKVEVFCFGTRLTRITDTLQKRNPDEALTEATKAVFDWEGGTKIGESLAHFYKVWGRRGMCRGSILIIASDGLERGDPDVLDQAMTRLDRLCHAIIWMNPLKGDDPHYEPRSVGMSCAMPFVDVLLSGHDLESLKELADVLPTLN
ncbi:MAG TPA: VWA domain-containing protein [Actinomycetota bacterium]|nr:VWA domain-containing protein [Actinomycetota bacterium]HEX2054340.1 VWA domain-containing protein [Actinomycetota bacterium]